MLGVPSYVRSPLVMLGVPKVGLGFGFFILERPLVMLCVPYLC